jgi:hypothetical protein
METRQDDRAHRILGVLVRSEIESLYEEDGRESPHTPQSKGTAPPS